ncbi:transcriptional repressor [bacterium]|nr:MAG: transcriptional repressor [bacterium]
MDLKASNQALLRKSGYKATPARLAILDILAKAKKPKSIEKIRENLDSRKIQADQATVYRTLNALKNRGIVSQIDLQHNHAHFELSQPENHHHHIVCCSCGRIEDVSGLQIEKLTKQILKKSPAFAAIKSHAFEFFGVCKNCQKKSGSKSAYCEIGT